MSYRIRSIRRKLIRLLKKEKPYYGYVKENNGTAIGVYTTPFSSTKVMTLTIMDSWDESMNLLCFNDEKTSRRNTVRFTKVGNLLLFDCELREHPRID